MTADLFDLARPVRDAAVAEIHRLTGGADFCPHARAANILGVHLTSVMLAFSNARHDRTKGPINDDQFYPMLASAVGTMIANAAMAFRPIGETGPATPEQTAFFLLNLIAEHTLQQTALNANGLQDYVVPIERGHDGALQVRSFDYTDMLKGKP